MNRPDCRICGKPAASRGIIKGRREYRRICEQCRQYKYKRHKKDHCEECGFIPQWSGQLDVDHIDGDKKNNEPANLKTLCANCHRLKTHLSKDYVPVKQR